MKTSIWLFGTMLLFMATGCIRYGDMAYMQDAKYLEPYENYRIEEYEVKPFDNLVVKMNSFDGELTDLINQDQTTIVLNDAQSALYFNSYTVDENGRIKLPLLGDVTVWHKTIEEIKAMLELMLKEYVKYPTVNVKLSNYQVTVLGEVQSPGIKNYYDSKLTIFQALGLAKDLTPYGNRKKVKLIRETEQGTVVVPLDLTNPNLMESDYYFLKPNDLIYVEPVKARAFQLNKTNVELITGLLTFGILMYSTATR
ncbi:MAG: polysaccharide biosynthesis/export family protein [Flavobacteriales bacterium]|nr:polysaccharide biosynthesis/export family protein [Flavobacteriales bacterium]